MPVTIAVWAPCASPAMEINFMLNAFCDKVAALTSVDGVGASIDGTHSAIVWTGASNRSASRGLDLYSHGIKAGRNPRVF